MPVMAKTTTPKKRQEPAVTSAASVYDSLPLEYQRFVDEYLVDLTAYLAYKRVPGNTQNDKTARTMASRLMAKDNIQQAIRERGVAQRKRVEFSADRVILEAARLATFDIRKLYRDDGTMKLPHEIDDDTAAAISSFEVLEEFEGQGKDRVMIGHTKKVRVVDKKGSVELAMKYHKLLTDRVEVNPGDKMIDFIRSLQGTALLPVASPPADDEDD